VLVTKNPMHITEHARARLARQICHSNMGSQGYIPILALSPTFGLSGSIWVFQET